MRGTKESLKALMRNMRYDPEFSKNMLPEEAPQQPQPATLRVIDKDKEFPPLGSPNTNLGRDLPRPGPDIDLPRPGPDKDIDKSVHKNKQKASVGQSSSSVGQSSSSVDQSSPSQNTVAQSPPSEDTKTPDQPKTGLYVPPHKREGKNAGPLVGKKS